MPSIPAITPFRMSPESEAMMVRPKKARAKYSAAPNFRAMPASCGARVASTTAAKSPPSVEAMVARPSALPALAAQGHRIAVENRRRRRGRAGRAQQDRADAAAVDAADIDADQHVEGP